MRPIDLRNKNLSVAIVCYFALLGTNERAKRYAKKDGDNELFHGFEALTLGAHGMKRPTKKISSHGSTSVAKKVAASAARRTIKYANPPKRNLKILKNQP